MEYYISKIVVAELEGPSTTSNKITIASGSQLDLVGSAGTTTIDASDITTGSLSSTLTFPGRLGDLENLPGPVDFLQLQTCGVKMLEMIVQ